MSLNTVVNISASIMMPQNGHPMMPPSRAMDSPSSYYNYSPQEQPVVPMHPGLPNGQSALSPAANPHKRLKRTAMSSISSADDDNDNEGEENESMSSYYAKSSLDTKQQWLVRLAGEPHARPR